MIGAEPNAAPVIGLRKIKPQNTVSRAGSWVDGHTPRQAGSERDVSESTHREHRCNVTVHLSLICLCDLRDLYGKDFSAGSPGNRDNCL